MAGVIRIRVLKYSRRIVWYSEQFRRGKTDNDSGFLRECLNRIPAAPRTIPEVWCCKLPKYIGSWPLGKGSCTAFSGQGKCG